MCICICVFVFFSICILVFVFVFVCVFIFVFAFEFEVLFVFLFEGHQKIQKPDCESHLHDPDQNQLVVGWEEEPHWMDCPLYQRLCTSLCVELLFALIRALGCGHHRHYEDLSQAEE